LLKYKIGISLLKNRRQFILVGSIEAKKIVQNSILPGSEKMTQQFCGELLGEIESCIRQYIEHPNKYHFDFLINCPDSSLELPKSMPTQEKAPSPLSDRNDLPIRSEDKKILYTIKDKTPFLKELKALSSSLSKDEILDLFLEMKIEIIINLNLFMSKNIDHGIIFAFFSNLVKMRKKHIGTQQLINQQLKY
jgi:hypothetical protein